MEFKDYYQTLGVERDADADAIKRAHRRLARKFHPDVSDEADAEERFKEVQEAYEVLKDAEKRAAYDQFGANWKAGQDFRPPPGWQPDVDFAGGGFTGDGDFSDFFESLFGRAHHRSARAGSAGGHGHARMRGEDLNARVTISLEDAHGGATRSLSLQVRELSSDGRVVTRPRTLSVKIPKGVTEGQRIRLAGQGNPGIGGAPAGDLYLQVAFQAHPIFHADGRDVFLDLPVAPWEAALGDTITVPTLAGNVDLRIPAGSQTGSRLRLKGRGLPGKTPGDQYVVLEVVLPRAESEQARALYEQMKQELAFDPRAKLSASIGG